MPEDLPDVIDTNLVVLFCGINPCLQAAATGHHFAGRGNRFWRAIHLAGFTPKELTPKDDRIFLRYGCGLTTVVERPTAAASLLTSSDLQAALDQFRGKTARYAPHFVAFLGKAAYCNMTGQYDVAWGLQQSRMEGAEVWILPNPSGRNRTFSFDRLIEAYRGLHDVAFR